MASAASYDEVKKQFTAVVGRPPSPEETEGLLHLKDAMGLRWDDPVFSLLMAMENHKAYFREIPAEMHKAADFMLSEAQGRLSGEVQKAVDGVNAVYARHREASAELSQKMGAEVITRSLESLQGAVRDTVATELKTVERESGKAIDSVRRAATSAVDQCHALASEWRRARWLAFGVNAVIALCAAVGGAWAVNWIGKEEVTDAQRGNMAVGEVVSANWSKLSPATQKELGQLLKE